MERFNAGFAARFERLLAWYERRVRSSLGRPWAVVAGVTALFLASLVLYPLLGVAFFPRTDAAQFVMNLKSPSGSRIEVTSADVERVERLVRRIVDPHDLELVVSNIGVQPGFSSIYTSNAGPHTATVQVALTEDHRIGSYEYMARVRAAIARELPHLTAYFQSGGMVDAVLNQGLPAPDRRAGERVEHRARVRSRQPRGRLDPEAAGRERRLHPAGHQLPVAAARRRPRARRRSSASTSGRSSTTSSPRSPRTR